MTTSVCRAERILYRRFRKDSLFCTVGSTQPHGCQTPCCLSDRRGAAWQLAPTGRSLSRGYHNRWYSKCQYTMRGCHLPESGQRSIARYDFFLAYTLPPDKPVIHPSYPRTMGLRSNFAVVRKTLVKHAPSGTHMEKTFGGVRAVSACQSFSSCSLTRILRKSVGGTSNAEPCAHLTLNSVVHPQ